MIGAPTWLLSALWSALTALGRRLSGVGWIKRENFGVRVISVGNIQVGGAGKTPLVALIANQAHEQGLEVCILCRGYRGEWETRGGILIPVRQPGEKKPESALCGDEPALLHDLAPNAYIGVGADRKRQFAKVSKLTGGKIDLVILDDGFQNFRVQKDLEIVALTSAGRTEMVFRDWMSSLRNADLLVWTKGAVRPEDHGKPMVKCRFKLPSAQPEAIDRDIWLVTGLASPAEAVNAVRAAGYRVARHVSFADHARYAYETVHSILTSATEAGCRVAITGKDWVKWRDLGVEESRVLVFEPEIIFEEEGRDLWNRVLWGP